jgi:hypothetical protein
MSHRRAIHLAKAALALILLIPVRSIAEIIPASRRMNWTLGTNVGVPGGIPNRTTLFVNVKTTANPAYHCEGDGVTDDSAALQAAMRDCPTGQVVYAPAGTYRLHTNVLVQFTQNFTLRGDGPTQTIFLCTGNSGGFHIGTEQWPIPTSGELTVTAGATPGSTVLTVPSTSTINVSNFVTLHMNTPTWMHTLNGTDSDIIFKMTFKVVSKTGTTVTISPSIPFDVSQMNPRIIPWGNSGGGHVTNGVGFEGFTIDARNGSSFPIQLEQAWGCWFKNIEISGTRSRQLYLLTACSCEIRRSYFHDTQGTGPSHEGVDFFNDGCWNLIEDNICVGGGKPAIILGDWQGGCVGNVIAYNYVLNTEGGNEDVFNAGISDSHGSGGNTLNLYEGNVCSGFQADGYFGGSSYGTLFRNYFHNQSINLGPVAVMLDHYSAYYNVVGNVLGSPGMTSEYDSEAQGYRTLIYRLGYPNMGNANYGGGTEGTPNPLYDNARTIGPTTPPDYTSSPNTLSDAQALDLNVKATILRHGNYDYASRRVIWDSTIEDHSLPNSLYRSTQPAWWGELPWPPIGPDRTPMVGQIPAQVRYIPRPQAPEHLRVLP